MEGKHIEEGNVESDVHLSGPAECLTVPGLIL